MRKWMRERLQRRKKKTAEPANQPAPPPLQPAYFDEAQPATPESEPAVHHAENHVTGKSEVELQPEIEVQPESEVQPENEAPSADAVEQPTAQPRKAGESQRSRGRRRRGGRGRGGRGREQAVAQTFAPAAGKGTIPDMPPDAAEEASGPASEPEAAIPVVGTPKIPAAAIPAAPPRPPKGIVVLAIGLPGSGKSSWFKRHNVVPLSSDMLRSVLFDDVREQRFQDLVFSNLRSMLKARLIAKRPINYVDATNLTPQERQHWIKLAKDYNYEVHAVFFDVPLDVCIERHQRRDRVVPEDIMRRMAAKLKPPAFEEGFAKITVVRVKKKEE